MHLMDKWPWAEIIDARNLPDLLQAFSEARAAGLDVGHEGLEDGRTLLMEAAASGWAEGCRAIAPHSNADAVDECGDTALVLAISEENHDAAEFLATVSSPSMRLTSDDPIIVFALEEGFPAVAGLLVERACAEDLCMMDCAGHTALIVAIENGCEDVALAVARGISAKGADFAGIGGQRAFELALDCGLEACALELAYKISPELANEDGVNQFEQAVLGGHWGCASALAARMPPLRRGGSEGEPTALALAWAQSRPDLALILASQKMPRHLLSSGVGCGASALHEAVGALDFDSAWLIAKAMGSQLVDACWESEQRPLQNSLLAALRSCQGDDVAGRAKWASQARAISLARDNFEQGKPARRWDGGTELAGLSPGQTLGLGQRLAAWARGKGKGQKG